MRTLIALSVLQTVGIAALIVHSFGHEDRIAPEQRPQNPDAAAMSPPHVRGRTDGAVLLDEERLRNIIKEELAQLQVQPNTQMSAPPAVAARPHSESSDRHRQELVAQQIETYRAVGSITDEQMQELQTGIAQLDEASRKQMMSKLIRALNSGDFKGRL